MHPLSKKPNVPRPMDLVRRDAISAFIISCSASLPSDGAIAMPMLVPIDNRILPRANGSSQFGNNSLGDQFNLCDRIRGNLNDREFVAAKRATVSVSPTVRFQSLRHCLQQRVPDRVTQRIVDGLEPIEIEASSAPACTTLTCATPRSDTLVEEGAVRKSCQGVWCASRPMVS